jgi:hypothetical protein
VIASFGLFGGDAILMARLIGDIVAGTCREFHHPTITKQDRKGIEP